MLNSESGPIGDREIDRALSDLLAQAEKEQISPQLRALAHRLAEALEDTRQSNGEKTATARARCLAPKPAEPVSTSSPHQRSAGT